MNFLKASRLLRHAAVFLATSVVAFSSISQASARELTVATGSTYRPSGFLTPDNKLIGFDIDVINAIAKDQGLEIKIVTSPFGALIPGLNNGDFDIAISAMTITKARLDNVEFSNPYQAARNAILVAPSASAKTLAELKNNIIGVGIGQTSDSVVSAMFGKDSPKIRRFENTPLLIEELLQGGVDAVVADDSVLAYYMTQNPEKNFRLINDDQFLPGYRGIAVKKGNTDLRDKLNAGLASIIKSGEYETIFRKWFNSEAPKLPANIPADII